MSPVLPRGGEGKASEGERARFSAPLRDLQRPAAHLEAPGHSRTLLRAGGLLQGRYGALEWFVVPRARSRWVGQSRSQLSARNARSAAAPRGMGTHQCPDAEPCVCNTRRPPVCGCCRHSENPVVTSADTAGPPAASERPKTRALPDGASPRACTAAHAQGAASNGHASRHPSLPTLQLGSSGAVTAAANGAACCRAGGAWRLVRGIPLRSLATCGSPAGQQPCKLQQLAAAAAAAPAQLGTTRCCC